MIGFRIRTIKNYLLYFSFGLLVFSCDNLSHQTSVSKNKELPNKTDSILLAEHIEKVEDVDSIQLIIPTFLGNERRNFSGNEMGNSLDEAWTLHLGSGETNVPGKGLKIWKGAGWTGQPLIVEEHGKPFIIQGCYDHCLKKIDATTGKVIWAYKYDDVLKGTGTIWKNPRAKNPENRIVIIQGSRRGAHTPIHAKKVYSYRAISYFTGKELWRMNSERSACYSRDVDASALIINDTAYVGLENGEFTVFSPTETILSTNDSVKWNNPRIFSQHKLYEKSDLKKHRGNIVTEASPSRIGDHIYIASGSGHVYGYNLKKDTIDWDFYIGSDMDGSPVVTKDNCLIVTVEKQYIKGRGGVFKLDPSKSPEKSVVWYFPTENIGYAEWKGGIIGSATVNDVWAKSKAEQMVAFNAIDGNLYVIKQHELADSLTYGPNKKHKYKVPKLVYKTRVGASISTPIFAKNKLISAGYSQVALFAYDSVYKFSKLASKKGTFEATPSVYKGQAFIASRNGKLYCLGKKDSVDFPVVLPSIDQQDDLAMVAEVDPDKDELALNTTSIIQAEKIDKPVKPVVEQKTIVQHKPVLQPKTSVKKESLVKTAPKPIIKPKSITKPAATNYSKAISTSPSLNESYHLIAGAFGVDGNAEKLQSQLRKKGVIAIVLPKTGKMTYVSVASSNSRENLKLKEREIKKQLSQSFWVLKR